MGPRSWARSGWHTPAGSEPLVAGGAHVSPRGLTTSSIPYGARGLRHRVRTSWTTSCTSALTMADRDTLPWSPSRSPAYAEVMDALGEPGAGDPDPGPAQRGGPVDPFADDHEHASA